MKPWKAGTPTWHLGFLHSYNLLMFLGIIFSFLTVAYFWWRNKWNWEHLQIILIISIPSAIFGARFYTLIFDGGWETWYKLAGMSIYGGVIGAIIPSGVYLYMRRHTLDWRQVFSIILPAVLLGQTIGRWGNFDNHEVYGKIVDGSSLNWLTFIKPHMYIYHPGEVIDINNPLVDHVYVDNVSVYAAYRAPIFFYESMFNLLGYILLVWVLNLKNWLRPGVTGSLYMVYYGIVRLVLQTQRDSSKMNTSYFGDSGISVNLVVSSLLIIIFGIIAILWQFNLGYSFELKGKKIVIWHKKEYKREYIKGKFMILGKDIQGFWRYEHIRDVKHESKKEINKRVSKKRNKG